MPYFTFTLFAILFLWLQTCLWAPLHLGGVKPDFLLIMSITISLHGNKEEWPVRYWSLGFLKDIFSIGPFGLNAIFFLLISTFVAKIREEIFREHPLTQALLVFLGVVVINIPINGLFGFHYGFYSPKEVFLKILTEACYSAVLAPLVMNLILIFRSSLGIRSQKDLSRAL